MFFKDKADKQCLPVWLSAIDAGIVLSQGSQRMPLSSPHNLTNKILRNLGLKVSHCLFTELRGHYQYVQLYFEGSDQLKVIESKADEAISFCLNAKARFFCKKSFINDCKVLDASMASIPGNVRMASRVSENLRPKYLN